VPKHRKTPRRRKWEGLLGRPSPTRTEEATIAHYAARWGIPYEPVRRRASAAHDTKLITELYSHYGIARTNPDKGTRQLILALAKDAGVPALQDFQKRRGRPITTPRVEILFTVAVVQKLSSLSPKAICWALAGKGWFEKSSAVALYDTFKKARKDYDALAVHFLLLIDGEKWIAQDIQTTLECLAKGQRIVFPDEQRAGSEIE
jgi:hypothetical protein